MSNKIPSWLRKRVDIYIGLLEHDEHGEKELAERKAFQKCYELISNHESDMLKILQEKIKQLEMQNQWRPISEAPRDIEVLLYDSKRKHTWTGMRVSDTAKNYGKEFIPLKPFANPTHFMSLPKPPEGE